MVDIVLNKLMGKLVDLQYFKTQVSTHSHHYAIQGHDTIIINSHLSVTTNRPFGNRVLDDGNDNRNLV